VFTTSDFPVILDWQFTSVAMIARGSSVSIAADTSLDDHRPDDGGRKHF
jgi:hypothetical protein